MKDLVVPRNVLERYPILGLRDVVAALWEHYLDKERPDPLTVEVPVGALLERLSVPHTPDTERQLMGVMRTVYDIHHIGSRIEGQGDEATLLIWLTPQLARIVNTYAESL